MSLLCRWLLARLLQIWSHIAIASYSKTSHLTKCTAAIENYNTCIIKVVASYIMHSYLVR